LSAINNGLLGLDLGLQLIDLVPHLLEEGLHIDRGMLGAAGHGFGVSRDRAPSSGFSELLEYFDSLLGSGNSPEGVVNAVFFCS